MILEQLEIAKDQLEHFQSASRVWSGGNEIFLWWSSSKSQWGTINRLESARNESIDHWIKRAIARGGKKSRDFVEWEETELPRLDLSLLEQNSEPPTSFSEVPEMFLMF